MMKLQLVLAVVLLPLSDEVNVVHHIRYGGTSETRSHEMHHESQIITIPSTRSDDNAKDCLRFSTHFCYAGYSILQERSLGHMLAPDPSELEKFIHEINTIYQKYRWFSFRDANGCCVMQMHFYSSSGMSQGLKATEYINKAIDFRSTRLTKRLNFIKAVFVQELCLNVISQVGFGIGQLERQGEMINVNYTLPLNANGTSVNYSYKNVATELTFDWIKRNILCQEEPWICAEFPLQSDLNVNCAVC